MCSTPQTINIFYGMSHRWSNDPHQNPFLQIETSVTRTVCDKKSAPICRTITRFKHGKHCVPNKVGLNVDFFKNHINWSFWRWRCVAKSQRQWRKRWELIINQSVIIQHKGINQLLNYKILFANLLFGNSMCNNHQLYRS